MISQGSINCHQVIKIITRLQYCLSLSVSSTIILITIIIITIYHHCQQHYYYYCFFGLEALYRTGASQALLQQGHRARGGLQPDCSKRRGKLANGVASQKSCPTHLSHV